MSPRTRNLLLIIGGALLISILSVFALPTGDPHVEVSPEALFYITPNFPFTNSLLVTLIVDVVLIVLAWVAARNMRLIPKGIQNIAEILIESLYNLFRGINEKYIDRAFPLVATIFLFFLISNWSGLIPGVGSIGLCEAYDHAGGDARVAMVGSSGAAQESENGSEGITASYTTCAAGEKLVPLFRAPSADLNVAFAVALIAWVFVEYWGFRALGLGYLKKFFNLNGIMSFVGIIEFISEIAKLFALAFRLFGNIFAGEVLLVVMAFLVPLFLPLPFYAFEVFVGFIQAFIFAILTMAFLSIAVTSHEHEGERETDAH